jgi:hypothetical protein
MRFFVDRCVPIAITKMVRGFEEGKHTFRHFDEDARFENNALDLEWIARLGEEGPPLWIVISGDARILRNKPERTLLEKMGLPFFCLDKPWPNTGLYEYAWKFMKVWPKILEAAEQKRGRIFKVSAGTALHLDMLL